MEIERAKLSCYTRRGNGFGFWETDIYLKGEDGRRIVHVYERPLMEKAGYTRKGTVKKPQAYLETKEGREWLMDYLLREDRLRI